MLAPMITEFFQSHTTVNIKIKIQTVIHPTGKVNPAKVMNAETTDAKVHNVKEIFVNDKMSDKVVKVIFWFRKTYVCMSTNIHKYIRR